MRVGEIEISTYNISIQNTSVYGWQCSTPVCLNGKLLYDNADIQLAIIFV